MRPLVVFVVVLVTGLALLTMIAWSVVRQTTRSWFERDLASRAQLAVRGAEPTLRAGWNDVRGFDLQSVLSSMARDERIVGAAACRSDLTLLAATEGFPAAFGCATIGPLLRSTEIDPLTPMTTWTTRAALANGRVHISAVPLSDGGEMFGFVTLVHDLGFLERREATTRSFLLAAFAVLALAASVVTMLSAHLAWRGWSAALRRTLRNGTGRPGFAPILHDVRELVERMTAERDAERLSGAWTAERLKRTLSHHLQGERVTTLANREPYIHTRGADGQVTVQHPASGLVTALEPVMRACSGVWIAHGGGTADRETVDAHDRVRVPPGEESYVLRRVWLSPEEERGYYYGFSNEGLWPLCHIAHARPTFRSEDWQHYQTVNRRFVDALCEEVDVEDPIILVQDYHLALAPQLIRARLPRATIISFWHVPWPNSERFGICPWRVELLDGLLGSSILGFHTPLQCNNFLASVDRFLEARIDREGQGVVRRGHPTLVRPYPISIEWPARWAGAVPAAADCRAQVSAELVLPPHALIGVGVDRLDYTKGLEERFLAVERLLEKHADLRGRFTFVQLAAPSRGEIVRYQELDASVEQLARRINERFGRPPYRPIAYLRAHHQPEAVFRYYRAADVCYVSSLHDGMNLVAKEFVAAREDERGVLVLSQFTGAARELTEALIVNPYDLDEASAALATALRMPAAEQRERMRALRTFVAEFNVYRWAGHMMVDAARLRVHERVTNGARPSPVNLP